MAKLTVTDAVHELWYWQFGNNPTNFTSRLFDLIGQADRENFARLQAAFPNEVNAWMLWQQAPDQNEFFRQWGCGQTAQARE